MQKLLRTLFSLICIFCVSFVGCEPKPTPTTFHPRQGDVTGLAESMRSRTLQSKQFAQLNTASTNLAGNNNSSPIDDSERITADKRNITTSNKALVRSVEQILATNDSTFTDAESPAFETTVKMPVLADNPDMADELIFVNFDQVDIRTVLKTIGDITGINFVVDASVSGNVTVMSPTKIRFTDIYSVLESILEVNGFAAVPAGDFVKIIPKANAARNNLQVRIGSNPADIPMGDTVVTQIVPLIYADADEISQIIRPLLAKDAEMSTYPRTNSIVITDTSSNIHHVAKIIAKLDVEGLQDQVNVFGLEYASAQVLSGQITKIMQKSISTSPQVGRNRTAPGINTNMKIMPDARTNSLIVVANVQDTETIRQLIEELDVPRPAGTNNVHVVYLKNAQPKEIAESLTGALANLRITGALEGTQPVQVTADEGTNALIIAASAQDYEVISQIIEKLDIVREQVLVEMLIMEVSEDSLMEIGIDWATLDKAVDRSGRGFAATNFGPRVDFVSGNLEGLALGMWRGAGDNMRIGSILHALKKVSGVNILSTPHILTSNHQKATIIIGENRPFVMESRVTETTDFLTPTVIKTYEYKDVGISLEITPHIGQGGLVRLEIDTEFTKLIEDVTTTSTDTPATAKRKATTVVSVNSGSTVVIGGLIRDDKVTIEKKIPFVGDLPLIGGLFRFRKDRLQKTNLIMFITPYVMSSKADLEKITEEKRMEMRPELEDLEKKTRCNNN